MQVYRFYMIHLQSLPSRERGLKFDAMLDFERHEVAPLAGAWIEIGATAPIEEDHCCRSPRGSVD